MDVVLPRRKKCKYGNKIFDVSFSQIIYIQREKGFPYKKVLFFT